MKNKYTKAERKELKKFYQDMMMKALVQIELHTLLLSVEKRNYEFFKAELAELVKEETG